MRVVNLQQGTLEWREWRRGGIGGSDVAAILGLSPFENATRENLLREKVQGIDRETNFGMRRGTRLEPIARRQFVQLTGISWEPLCGEDEYAVWPKVSLDGINADHSEILEIKCANWQTHDLWLHGFVPEYYLVQMQWQMMIVGCDRCHAVCFNNSSKFPPERHLAYTVVEADAEQQAELLQAAEEFWNEVCAARENLVAA